MKVGLIGDGGREHALAEALIRNPQGISLFAYISRQNPGIERCAEQVAVGDLADCDAIVNYFQAVQPAVVMVGPEKPLVSGVVDALRGADIPTVGPTQAQARLEGDKTFMRGLLERRIGWGSPRWRSVQTPEAARDFIAAVGEVAVKPIGLTGGKGVRVMGVHLPTADDALTYARELMDRNGKALLEERLIGEEFSRMLFASDGEIAPMPVAQDFKYAYDGDTGGMTGGMGAYTMPDGKMPFLTAGDIATADRLLASTLQALAEETGAPYRGVLYGQFIATGGGIRAIEFNVRLGDPEGINSMTLLQSDAAELFRAVARGKLKREDVQFARLASLCKYLVPKTYPQASDEPIEFTLDEERVRQAQFSLTFGSVRKTAHGWQTLGSRTLALVGLGADLPSTSKRMEELLAEIEPPGLRHRRDVGDERVLRAKAERMERLRAGARG